MNSKSARAMLYRLLGLACFVCATCCPLKVDIDVGEWFGILGVYLIATGDYYELKER